MARNALPPAGQKKMSAPPLCYEFSALVSQRIDLEERDPLYEDDQWWLGPLERKSTTRKAFQLAVSKKADTISKLSPRMPPYDERAIRRVWAPDARQTDARQPDASLRCLMLEVEPFFDEAICTLLPDKGRLAHAASNSSEGADGVGCGSASADAPLGSCCSSRVLAGVMPLDQTSNGPSDVEYTHATLVPWEAVTDVGDPVAGQTEMLLGRPCPMADLAELHAKVSRPEVWQWRSPSKPVTLPNAEGIPHLSERVVTFLLEVDAAATKTCGGKALLRGVHSTLAIRKDRRWGRPQPNLLASSSSPSPPPPPQIPAAWLAWRNIMVQRTTTLTTFAPLKDAATAALPPYSECYDARVTSDGDTRPDATATRGTASAGGSAGEASLARNPEWLSPPPHLLRRINDPYLIAGINSQRGLSWTAGPSAYLAGRPLLDLRAALGALGTRTAKEASRRGGKHRSLPLRERGGAPPPSPLASRAELPARFDAREAWPECAEFIGRVRNQGGCGSCWAFGAIESLADRICIASRGKVRPVLSAQSLVDCDAHDGGCDGGYTDSAWRYLQSHGAQPEACMPYRHCEYPSHPNCSSVPPTPGVPQPPPLGFRHPPSPPSPPGGRSHHRCSRCVDGTAADAAFRASSAYAVAPPGDAEGMMAEIMAHGPIEASFYVYSDFVQYAGGVYTRSANATGPIGGHAVRVVGWGVEEGGAGEGVPYWLVANTWSVGWGELGFFRIRRGVDECGFEATPAAGLPALSGA